MTKVIDNLRMFNRKERFFLVGMALGNPNSKLCRGFRQNIGQTFALDIPEDAFAAMDYHLDWSMPVSFYLPMEIRAEFMQIPKV